MNVGGRASILDRFPRISRGVVYSLHNFTTFSFSDRAALANMVEFPTFDGASIRQSLGHA